MDKIHYWFSYYLIKAAMKLRLYVLDYHFGPVEDGTVSLVVSGRWRWQKQTEA